ncbi:MAG: SDR family oxidoreductase [Gordonia sp. (in: high G+C Gram-positive bacteria)]|uniref:SDR family oxidoreductase n=1 Tax=Gordonia sp. (in: high G+C Gram-positive bacteria) TaxID=84139 RepID=UPI0039E55F53
MTPTRPATSSTADLGLKGRVVLVTGGARGVGAGIATVLDGLGAIPIVCARNKGEDSFEFHSCDVRDSEAVAAMIKAIVDKHGRLDGVVNNAGGSPFALAADASDNFARKIVELNLVAPLVVARAAHAVMAEQDGGGAIVNVSSVSGHRPSPGTSAYGAAKAGLDNLTESLAVEWAPAVRLNSVVCGPVETELSHLHYGDADGVAAVGATIPMGRLAAPADIGNAVAFLLSPLAAYITGSTLTVHGGGEKPAFLDAGNSDNRV